MMTKEELLAVADAAEAYPAGMATYWALYSESEEEGWMGIPTSDSALVLVREGADLLP